MKDIVCIKELDPLPLSCCYGVIATFCCTSQRSWDYLQIVKSIVLQNSGGAISGAIIHNDDLDLRPGLRQDRLDRLAHIARSVVAGDAD